MSVLAIRVWPDKILNQVSAWLVPEAVARGEFEQLVSDMFDTLYEAGGVGLAAVQVGALYRVFVMDAHEEQHVFFNPRIVGTVGNLEMRNEGCLSLPGIVEHVPRYDAVKVRYLGRDGQPQERDFSGLEAQCVQHESEHLDGITIPDKLRMGSVAKEMLRKRLAKEK